MWGGWDGVRGPSVGRVGRSEGTGSPRPGLVDSVKPGTMTPMGKASRRKKVTDPAKLKAYRPPIPFVARPYEGLPKEIELVAMRELIPAATLTARTDADHGAVEFDFVTLLPEGHPAMVRPDGRILVALQTRSNSADLGHDAGASRRSPRRKRATRASSRSTCASRPSASRTSSTLTASRT